VYRQLSVVMIVPVLDEAGKIGEVVRRAPRALVDEVVVVDDGSTDGSRDEAAAAGATVIELGHTQGVGVALRTGFERALASGADAAVVAAGNNKDAPEEIPALLDPIADDRADLVQGSRFLSAGANLGDMPRYRRVAVRLHSQLFSRLAGCRVTDSTNGFRAIRTSVLRDPNLELERSWLDAYELEPYLLLRAIKLGYRFVEAPVTKVYPDRALGQTKMRPVLDWWSILRPLADAAIGDTRLLRRYIRRDDRDRRDRRRPLGAQPHSQLPGPAREPSGLGDRSRPPTPG
jgi:dolichol-phosphate mannosyltransferase